MYENLSGKEESEQVVRRYVAVQKGVANLLTRITRRPRGHQLHLEHTTAMAASSAAPGSDSEKIDRPYLKGTEFSNLVTTCKWACNLLTTGAT